MCKKVFGFLLVLVMVTVAFAGDYYLVEPEGKMVQVEKRGETFVPIRGAKPIDSPVTSFMSPGFVDTTQMNMFESGYYFPNRDSNSVHLQYFQSGFACSLMAVGFEWYSAGTAEAYVWEAPDPMPSSTEDLQAHLESAWEFDTVANNWVAMDPILSGPELVTVDDAVAGWYELPSKIDIGTSFVGVGYRILDPENPDGTPYGGNPWGLSDDFVDQYGFGQYAPCITWMYRVQHAHPSVGQFFGWVPYGDQVGDWRFYYVIDIYVNAPPSFVSYDRLPGSYITDARTVSAYLYDFGVPSDMAGVDEAVVYYWTDSEPEPVALAMSLVDGTPEEGRWEAEIPGQTGWTTVHYYIEATDMQGVASMTPEVIYTIGAGVAGHVLVMLEGDAYIGDGYSAINAITRVFSADVWDESYYGPADQSVLDFYTSGAGQKGIFWVGWGGTSFAADTTWIGEFLDAGGNLFLSAQDVVGGGFELGYDEGVVIPADHWLNRYMGIKGVFDDYNLDSTFTLYGMAGDPISDDFQAGIEVSPYYWVGPGYNYAGRFDSLDANAELVFMDGFGANLGYRMDTGTYKIVFLYWPFNYIGSYIEEDTVAQITLIENVRDWMGLTAIDEPEVTTIKELTLYQATPNPFARFTTIKYAMPQAGRVSLKVYNLSGRVVNTILDDQVESGIHSVMWDGKDSNGQKVPAGVYFYQLRTGNTNATQKTIMIR